MAVLAAKFAVMRPIMDERTWRVYLGSEARALGHGGIAAVARASGCSETTVAAGVGGGRMSGALEALAPGRARRPGGGRKKAGGEAPGVKAGAGGLLEAATRGDPMVEITWCSLSLRDMERQMAALGFAVREGRARADAARGRLQPAGDVAGDGGEAAPGPGRPVPAHQRA